jgi:hypothetical protein
MKSFRRLLLNLVSESKVHPRYLLCNPFVINYLNICCFYKIVIREEPDAGGFCNTNLLAIRRAQDGGIRGCNTYPQKIDETR